MQDVQLKVPAVDASGAVRHPAEGVITIDDDTAGRWRKDGMLADDSEHWDDEDQDDGLEKLTLPDLGILVTKEGVPLNGVTKKDDIIAAIRAHRAPAE